MKTYTIEQFKKYLHTQYSLGDIHYYLTEENIDKANDINQESDDEFEPDFNVEPIKFDEVCEGFCDCKKEGPKMISKILKLFKPAPKAEIIIGTKK